jgi:hypothetical protein
MMIPIQDNVLVNTDRISVVQLRKIKDKVRVEVIVDNRSYIVDDDKINGEFRQFLRGTFDDTDNMNQFVNL